MGLLGKFKEQSIKTETIETGGGYQSFSTPFLKIGKENLSLPFVWDKYQTNGYIPFGENNLYPQYLNQMYYTSPLHGSVVDFKVNASVGGGYEVDLSKLPAKDKVKYYTIEKRLNLDKLVTRIALDQVLHDRVYFCIRLEMGKVISIKHVGAEKVRVNKEKTKYFVSDDYYNNYKAKEYKPYDKYCKEGEYILAFETLRPGQDIYP